MTVQASDFRLGARLDPIEVGFARSWKSIYPIFRGEDDLIAYVGIPNGWGRSWTLMPIKAAYEGAEFRPDEGYASITVHGKNAKNNAIERLVEMFTETWFKHAIVEFKSASEIRAAKAAEKQKRADATLTYQANLVKSQEQRRARLDGLRSIGGKAGLTEVEYNAITKTVELLQAEVDHYQRQLDKPEAA